MPPAPSADPELGRELVLDELFDLSLYVVLKERASGRLRDTLEQLIPIETQHYHFWEDFFHLQLGRLNLGRRLKLRVIAVVCAVFGERAIYLILEAIDIYGIRKYLTIWKIYRDTPLAEAVKTILQDEFGHEDQIVSG